MDRPPVVVRDPARPSGPPDALADLPPRRWPQLVAGVLLLAGLVVLVYEVRATRVEQEQVQRARQVVSLDTVLSRVDRTLRTSPGRVVVGVRFPVQNSGPLPVEVVEAVSGDLALVDRVTVPAGGVRVLAVERVLACGASGGQAEDVVRLRVRTSDGRERPAELRTGTGDLRAPDTTRTCGGAPDAGS